MGQLGQVPVLSVLGLVEFPHHVWLLFTADLHTLPHNLTDLTPSTAEFQSPKATQVTADGPFPGGFSILLVLWPAPWIPGCCLGLGLLQSQHHQLPPLLSAPKLQEKERNKAGQKKSLSSLQQLEEEGFSEQSGVDANAAKTLQVCGAI